MLRTTSIGLAANIGSQALADTSIGIKEQIGPLPGDLEVAVIVALSVPPGSSRVGSHGFDPFVKIPWSRDLMKGWSVGL